MPTFEPQSIVLATLVASLLLFATDALRYDLIAVLVVLLLAASGVLTPQEAFSGFSSPAVVLVASMFLFAHAMGRWGLASHLGHLFLGRTSKHQGLLTARVHVVAGLCSSMLSDTAVTATLIPVLGSLSRKSQVPLSKLLIPLSYGSLVGGMVTVVGTSVNVAINGVIEEHGGRPFGLFEFTPYGLCILGVSALYFLFLGHLLLPHKRADQSLSEHYKVPEFVTEVLVDAGSTLINRSVAEVSFGADEQISLLGIVRSEGEGTLLAPGPYNRIRSDDVLILQGRPEAILRMRHELGLRLREHVEVGDTRLDSDDVQLVEAVVPAFSRLADRTLSESDFRASTGLNVLAVSKHGRVQPTVLRDTRLEVGDSLLIQGHTRDVERVQGSRELLVLGELEPPEVGRGAFLTLLSGAFVVIASVGFGMHLSVAALAGAAALVMTRAVRPDEVRNTVDWSVLILIGGMLALGRAFDKHGLGRELAEQIAAFGGGAADPRLLLALLLGSTVLLSQLTNYVTAGVIMAPVALSLAEELATNPRTFLMAVVTGASLALISPVAHQANTMVMGPGDYRYRDFVRVGTPLTLLLAGTAFVLLPIFWPFSGAG